MTAIVIIGAQWGDEGKGKVVDLLAESAQLVVRYGGGPNAGHTLVVGNDKVVFRLVPSGILHEKTRCLLGQGMALNPAGLLQEIDELESRNITVSGRLHVSDLVHLILPYHLEIDGLREASAHGTKIGTTKRGIGPCYEDRVGGRGVRACDLRDPRHLAARVEEAIANWEPTIRQLGGKQPSAAEICDALSEQAPRLLPMLCDGPAMVDRAIDAGQRIMLEGAQGTMLDVDHGTYPFVTSSSAIAGGACTGAGIGPTRLQRVIGITKAYATRVGAGPFPTEETGAVDEHLRTVGDEYGSVTRRPRRTGWLDLPALRYARRVNGLAGLAVTKLDVLTGLDVLKVCVGYRRGGSVSPDFPLTTITDAEPVYETFPGWTEPLHGCRSIDELPAAASRYLRFVEEEAGMPLYLVSVGPRRDQTIVLRDAWS